MCRSNIVDIFIEQSELKTADKNDILLKNGQVCNNIIYIKKGITRHFTTDKQGKEITKNFTMQSAFVLGSISSFLAQTSGAIQFQALTHLEYYELPYNKYLELIKIPEFIEFWHDLLGSYIIRKEVKEISFLKNDATKRYENFLKEFSGLINQIPHYYIASYLGISSEALSRVRRSLTF